MEFTVEFCTKYKPRAPCLRLKETLNLLKNRLWLSSVRMEFRHVPTVFWDILSETV
jgi:hypothetical protein